MKDEQLALFGGKPVVEKPFVQLSSIGEEEIEASLRVLRRGVLSDFVGRAGEKFLGGVEVKNFEREFSKYFKVKHAVSFNSATTALQAAVAALGIGPGDEVITSPYTMSATASAILLNGALPVFADLDPESYSVDPHSVESRISARTKALLTVNIFGGSSDYDALIPLAQRHKLPIIEDNAQAIGAMYRGTYLGTLGDIGVFSFNVHKTLQSGEGGVLVTNNDELAYRAQLVRNHGEVIVDDTASNAPYQALVGSNYRLTELQAAIAAEQLKKMDILTRPRQELAVYLSSKLTRFAWLAVPKVLPETTHVYYVYPFRFDATKAGFSREAFAAAMKAEGFPLNQGYVKPLYLMPVYQKRSMFSRSRFPFESSEYPSDVSYDKGICPVVERLYEHEFLFTTLCHYPRTKNDIDLFVHAVEKTEHHRNDLAGYRS